MTLGFAPIECQYESRGRGFRRGRPAVRRGPPLPYMPMRTTHALVALAVAGIAATACSKEQQQQQPPSTQTTAAGHAPDTVRVRFETTKGQFVVEAYRDWAPLGVDRFYELANQGYYNGVRFFRVLP